MPQRDLIIYPGEPLPAWEVVIPSQYGLVCRLGDHLMPSGTLFRRTALAYPECLACVEDLIKQEAA